LKYLASRAEYNKMITGNRSEPRWGHRVIL